MSQAVAYSVEDGIAVLAVQNPPVNALGIDVRLGLASGIEKAGADAHVTAVLIYGEGRTFPAGADIREFGKPPKLPNLPEVVDQIEACPKPVVAALHGTALGGGLEVALGAHYRIAAPTARIGLPEVNLGILPGAGGTQRMPRIAGAGPTLEIALSGKPMSAKAGLACGVLDVIAETDDMRAEGLAYAKALLAEGKGPRPTADRKEGFADKATYAQAVEAARKMLAVKAKGLFSPFKIVDCIEAAPQHDIRSGLDFERAAFMECMNSPQREGLIHAFFIERESAKVPEAKTGTPLEISKMAVIGGGTMGAGITVSLLDAGLPVVMIERDDESVARGRANVEAVYDRQVAKGRITLDARDAVLSRYSASTDYGAIGDADMVIEAVFEEIDVKKGVFAQLDAAMKPGAILATNTSYLNIDDLAATISRPEAVVGTHFFSPANIMKLLEIVVPEKATPDAIATCFALAKRMKKVPVRAGVCEGFIGNRILTSYKKCADYLVEDGASPYAIDEAIRNFGYPMGPFQMFDLAGQDIGWATRKRLAPTRDNRERYVHISDRLCENGWFGQKTGRGYYLYEEGARVGTPDPEVEAIIVEERTKAGITPRDFSEDEIIRRYLAAMINEGANVVADGIALRPLDVDVTLLYGYGFPRYRGGPMQYADMQGLDTILADIEKFAGEDDYFWQPSPLLKDLVAKGDSFASLNTLKG